MSELAPPASKLIRYASLAFPLAFAGYPLYIFAPDFYATNHGVSLALLGAILMCLRLFDAFLDPVIGHLSDKGSVKIAPLFIMASVVLSASLLFLFNPISDFKAVWFGVFMLFATLSTSLLTINYTALGGVWSANTSVSAYREGFSLIGILIAVTLPSFISLTAYCLILAVLLALGLMIFFKWHTNYYVKSFVTPNSHTLLQSLKSFSTPTKKLYIVYFLSMLASSFPAVLVIFFIRDVLKAEALTGAFLLLYFLSGAISMPFWHKISVKFGKNNAWAFGMMLATLTFSGAYFLTAGDSLFYALICIASGFALGADLALPPALLSENIAKENKSDLATTHFAMLAFLAKLSLALASFIALSLIDLSGFKPNSVNSVESLAAVSILYAALPVFIKILATTLLFTKGHHHETV